MDEPGAAGSLLSLNDSEHRFYSACLRSVCPRDETCERLPPAKVAELFRASQLPPESLHKVTEVCGAKRLGFFGKPQFFVALKLIAAAQSGLPIRPESVTSNLPLPRFVGLKNEPEMRYSNVPPGVEGQGTPCGTGSVPWTPADRRHLESTAEKTESWSPPRSPRASPPPSPPSYHSFPYIKHKNGADAQIMYESKQSSRPMVQLEQHHSPAHYRTNTAVEHPAMARASSAERLDHHTAAGDHCDDDPWRITAEQLEYYTNQFKSLQPDLGALVLGAVAKNFFTKSKLPIPELSHIWELSDVDRDGALTFSEFCTAFHLIVARKNGYALPESLPPTLRPGFLQQQQQQQEDVPDTPESAQPLIVFEDAGLNPSQMDQSIFDRIQPTARQNLKEESRKQDVSLRSSQRKQTLQLGAFPHRPEPPQELDPQMRTKTRPRSYSSTSIEDAMKKAEEPPTPPPRPQKTHSRASSLDLNKLLQQGAPGVKSGWLLPPPALPPRPSATQASHFINATEKKPPSQVQQLNFADFSHFREEDENCVKPEEKVPHADDSTNSSKQAPQKPVRRKYHPESGNPETPVPPSMALHQPPKPAQKLLSRQKREIQMAIRKNRETKAVLTRLNSELQQQLKVVHQERVTLESQLELVRPLAST